MKSSFWDTLGTWLAGLCIVDCTVLPLLFVLFPMLSFFESGHELVHKAFALLVIPTATISAVRGYRAHRKAVVPILFVCGLALFITGAFVGEPLLSEESETPMFIIGGMLMVIAHWKNRRACACSCQPVVAA